MRDQTGVMRPILRVATRLVVIAGLIWACLEVAGIAMTWLEHLPAEQRGPVAAAALVVALLVYAVLLAVPFVPGVEIGIMVLAMKGAAVAPLVYAATCLGLMLAYLAGRLLPEAWLEQTARDLRLRRMARLVAEVRPMSRARRLALLRRRLPRWAGPYAIRLRYLGLALLLNVPGNSVLGGGGGLCLLAGLTRLFSTKGVFLAIAIGVAPVPLAVWLLGWQLPGTDESLSAAMSQ